MSGTRARYVGSNMQLCFFAPCCSCVGHVKSWLLLLKAHHWEAGIQKHKTVKIPAVDERKRNPLLLSKKQFKREIVVGFFCTFVYIKTLLLIRLLLCRGSIIFTILSPVFSPLLFENMWTWERAPLVLRCRFFCYIMIGTYVRCPASCLLFSS